MIARVAAFCAIVRPPPPAPRACMRARVFARCCCLRALSCASDRVPGPCVRPGAGQKRRPPPPSGPAAGCAATAARAARQGAESCVYANVGGRGNPPARARGPGRGGIPPPTAARAAAHTPRQSGRPGRGAPPSASPWPTPESPGDDTTAPSRSHLSPHACHLPPVRTLAQAASGASAFMGASLAPSLKYAIGVLWDVHAMLL